MQIPVNMCWKKSTDIVFKLYYQDIILLNHSLETFLGSRITFNRSQSDIYKYIYDSINGTLTNILASLIRNEYKLKVFKEYPLPAIRFK